MEINIKFLWVIKWGFEMFILKYFIYCINYENLFWLRCGLILCI